VQRYLQHLNLAVEHSVLDAEDRVTALQEDRQGLGPVAPANRILKWRGYLALRIQLFYPLIRNPAPRKALNTEDTEEEPKRGKAGWG
jgi:hypothetical protein